MMELFWKYAVPALITTVVPLVLVALKALANKWAAEGKESKGKALAARLLFISDLVIADLNATMKAEILADAEDGMITPEEGAELKAHAIERLKELLKENGFKEIKEVFGILLPSIEVFLSGLVEKAVETAKQSPQ